MRIQQIAAFQINAECKTSVLATMMLAKKVRIPAQCRPGSPVILGHLC